MGECEDDYLLEQLLAFTQSVTDAKSNSNSILEYDWHSLQALKMEDANDNITEMCYDALGLAVAMAVKARMMKPKVIL